ncbi:LOW QUALITY PROTEIN: DNA polymerase delta subunit 3-like [Pomacea canaliculata]|uniref:LOW QUALITY PROTEIN: DNA polymerase delta subunit 3-like n=1 Tax=Pomacea canaliculata TaxID=400727 RepID=UPI000D72B7CD|nr:LOW QUALITY PROTEIN: DNA polymerase delta subunit 3-like [Pomacea canaliculata]
MAADALCLENIDEYVNDENKIVTCKWLSLTLKIHINQAKRLLYTFLHKQKQQKNQQVNATYFVAGLSQNSHGIPEHKCLVVPEEDLEATRRQLSVVTSCHIYSVQRAQVKDPNVLYMADYDGMKENQSDINRYSSILCKQAAVPRSRPSVTSKVPEKIHDSHQESNSNKTEEMKQSNTDSSAKKSSAEDFRKKEDSSMKPQKEENKTDKAPPKKGSVMDLFANAKPLVKPKAAETKKFPAVAETKATNKDSISSTQSTKRNTKKEVRIRDDSDDEEPERKRRRRIRYDMSESSSEEEIEVQESPLPSPAKEPSPQPESPTPKKKEQTEMCNNRQATTPRENSIQMDKVRRRRRKLVPKTSLDEDGFMVTENVWESESTDASEMEDEAKKAKTVQKPTTSPPKTSPRKKPSPVKGKQTSLMSFFKKK